MMIKNVLDYLYNSKEKYPLKTAVADDKSSMTYTELVDNATAIAAGLSEYVGVRRAVPVYMDKSCVALAAFMGVVMTDNFYVLSPTSVYPLFCHLHARIPVTLLTLSFLLFSQFCRYTSSVS